MDLEVFFSVKAQNTLSFCNHVFEKNIWIKEQTTALPLIFKNIYKYNKNVS